MRDNSNNYGSKWTDSGAGDDLFGGKKSGGDNFRSSDNRGNTGRDRSNSDRPAGGGYNRGRSNDRPGSSRPYGDRNRPYRPAEAGRGTSEGRPTSGGYQSDRPNAGGYNLSSSSDRPSSDRGGYQGRPSSSGYGNSRPSTGGFGGGRPSSGGFGGSRPSRSGYGGGRPGGSSFGGGRPGGSRFGGSRFGGGRPGGSRFGGNRGGGGGGRGSLGVFIPLKDLIKAGKTPEQLAQEHEAAQVAQSQGDFTKLGIDEQILKNLVSKGYTSPTPIQEQAIPLIMQKKDLVGLANTGTGKSAAFLIPLAQFTKQTRSYKSLVVVPTRELALQLVQELGSLTHGMQLRAVLCVGGTSLYNQVKQLRAPHNFVIGTPGRLKDLVNRGNLRLQEFSAVVLDEVDRMLDMGFINDVRFLVDKLPATRQSLFFSATLDAKVNSVLSSFSQNPEKVSVKTSVTSDNVEQNIIRFSAIDDKLQKLVDLLKQDDVTKAIVFVRTKHGADKLNTRLFKEHIRVNCIHGDKRQNYRDKVVSDFKAGVIDVLVATDVAARGLDVAGVSHVINFDMPATYEDYTHRIGRTGRGGKLGKALTFVEASRTA